MKRRSCAVRHKNRFSLYAEHLNLMTDFDKGPEGVMEFGWGRMGEIIITNGAIGALCGNFPLLFGRQSCLSPASIRIGFVAADMANRMAGLARLQAM